MEEPQSRAFESRATLHLNAPVRVTVNSRVLPVRRKGLALLSYLALEGPTRRERLADVLWDHPRAMPNLRVELHRLRTAFTPVSIDPVVRMADPVMLDPAITLAPIRTGSDLLEGFEDLSIGYQAWLEYRRGLLENGLHMRASLLEVLASEVAAPFVVVVQGAPRSGRRTLARGLARRLRLPFIEGADAAGSAVRYVPPDRSPSDDLAPRIVHDRQNIWVIGRSIFGPDSPLVHHLRARIDPDRMRFHRLDPLGWLEARGAMPPDIEFEEGARLYLTSGGHLGYLTELLKMRDRTPPALALPIPQSVRAAFAVEAHLLSPPARAALERLSVHAGSFTADLISVLGASHQLDELEANGWLAYDGHVWRHADPMSARLLRAGLLPGQALHLHQRVAEHLSREGASAAAEDHLRAAGLPPPDPVQLAVDVTTDHTNGQHAPRVHVSLGHQVSFDEPDVEGPLVSVEGTRVLWSRLPTLAAASHVIWTLRPDRLVIRVRARSQIGPATEPVGREPALFRMVLVGAKTTCVKFTPAAGAMTHVAAWKLLPGAERFDYSFIVEDARCLRLECDVQAAVIDVDVQVFGIDRRANGAVETIEAIDLNDVLESSLSLDSNVVGDGHSPRGPPLTATPPDPRTPAAAPRPRAWRGRPRPSRPARADAPARPRPDRA